MKPQFWNERYGTQDYIYGVKPNAFFQRYIDASLPGKLLLPAEGEGRNAVYAALHDWQADCFDQSLNARDKALSLAKKHNVDLHYEVGDAQSVELLTENYDLVALVFAHMPPAVRTAFHRRMIRALKPGGTLLLQGFAKSQLGKPSGGPKVAEMLFSLEELRQDFAELTVQHARYATDSLDEGPYHQGEAHLVEFIAQKPE